MATSRKSDPLYSLDLGSVNPRFGRFVVFNPLDEVLFNTIFSIVAHYFFI
jgi:hypothetical protein